MDTYITEETHETCTLCGGRGKEFANYGTNISMICRCCQGTGQRLVRTVTKHHHVDIELLADAVMERLAQRALDKAQRALDKTSLKKAVL